MRPLRCPEPEKQERITSPVFQEFDIIEIQLLDLSRHLLERSSCAKRETMGDTYIKPLFALLLHCGTKGGIGLPIPGYLQAQQPPVYEAGKMIMRGTRTACADTDDRRFSGSLRMVASAQLIESLR